MRAHTYHLRQRRPSPSTISHGGHASSTFGFSFSPACQDDDDHVARVLPPSSACIDDGVRVLKAGVMERRRPPPLGCPRGGARRPCCVVAGGTTNG